jgi:hypothetical protein
MRVEAQQARAGWPVRSCRPEGEARHTAAEATLGPENVGGPVVTANGEGEARHTAAEATRSLPGTHTLQRRRGRRFYLQSAGD